MPPADCRIAAIPSLQYCGPVKSRTLLVLAVGALAGCSSLLPKSKETTGAPGVAWQSYQDAQRAFDSIVPGKTTVAELGVMQLDPRANPNITVLPRHELMQRFIVNASIAMDDLDGGVRDCLEAREQCRALEVNQTATQKKRTGNAALDMAKVYRETHTSGWRFCGLLLVKDGVVIYKLTSGQPAIHEVAQDHDALAPLQTLSAKLKLDTLNGIGGGSSSGGAPSEPQAPVTAFRRK